MTAATCHLLPTMQIVAAITMSAIIAPLDRLIDPELLPAAPALLSPAPAEDPASPADGPKQQSTSLSNQQSFE